MVSIAEIKKEYKSTPIDGMPSFIERHISDERSGVQAILEAANRQLKKLDEEKARIEALRKYEERYGKDYTYISGTDEVGRGPLCGPVVACTVILPKDCRILYINDSKQLSAAKREELYDIIRKEAVSIGIGIVSPQRIDEINILQATYEAMRQSVDQLDPKPDLMLNDAVRIPGIDIPQVPIIKGDATSISIGAASIIAKVTRDRMMVDYDRQYPGYGMAKNMGYGTKEHIEALKRLGPTPIHRRSFIGNFI